MEMPLLTQLIKTLPKALKFMKKDHQAAGIQTISVIEPLGMIRGRRWLQAERKYMAGKALGALMMFAMALTNVANAAVITTAGEITGIANSQVQDNTTLFSAVYNYSLQTDGVIHIVLDLGSVQNVDVLTFVNRNISTNFAISRLEILVAPDENAAGFDPYSLASYTKHVFVEQQLSPHNYNASAVRNANIDDTQSRYFLINFTESFHTVDKHFSSTPNQDRVQFSDIRYSSAIPEPGAAALVGLALAGGILHRWRKR